MKIKFSAPEMANFEGMYGAIEFKDGVSINHVTEADVRLYSAITSIEVIGEDFTPEKSYDELKGIHAISVNLPTLADLQAMEMQSAPASAIDIVAPEVLYTKAQLEEIADKSGIAGIREIADKLNIRGNSISKLIQSIIESQAKFTTPAAEFIETPKEAVTLDITDPLIEGEGA